jgi:glycine/D-amino acid oxidase-like deaminating enzyme
MSKGQTLNDKTSEVRQVTIRDTAGTLQSVETERLVLALGPSLKKFGKEILGINFPVKNELHSRIQVEDPLELIPEGAPFLIWGDNIDLPYTQSERRILQKQGLSQLLNPYRVPGIAGAHLRPLSSRECNGLRSFFGIWTYDNSELTDNPMDPPPNPELYAQVVLRGLSRMVPSLSAYFPPPGSTDPFSFRTKVTVKSGYYCKTLDNTPLLGPIKGKKGMFLCGGVSGFGVMCSQGAAEIVGSQVLASLDPSLKKLVPEIASDFDPQRFDGTKDEDFFESGARTANQL